MIIEEKSQDVEVKELSASDKVLEKIKNKETLSPEDLAYVKSLYLNYATDIVETVGKKWFPVSKMCKKLHVGIEDAKILLEQLIYFELAVCKKEQGLDYYKIDISKEDLKIIINNEIEKLTIQVEYLRKRLEKLNKS